MPLRNKFSSSNTLELLKRMGWFLVFMQITRLLFFYFNQSILGTYTFNDFIGGLWFDIVTFNLIGLPYVFFHSLPFKFRDTRIYRIFLNTLYYILLLSCLAFNLVDVEYYKHSHKRSTIDLFSIVSGGSDFKQQLGSFFRDFWFLFMAFIIFVIGIYWIHKKTFRKVSFTNYKREIIVFVVTVVFGVILGRGGFGLRPISTLNVSYFTTATKTGLVLNTPFTIIKSYGKQVLEIPDYYSEKELITHFNPNQNSQPQHLFKEKQNVVIILLESFGAEFVGCAGAENSFTPFLDSIAGESLNFKYGIANGKRSIEAIPAIYLSVPTWMDEAYITSPYASNQVKSLAEILNENQYETAFFHGATNGSMRFDAFTRQVGVTHYLGRSEYNNDKDFDGTWGIVDEKFLPWSAKKMSEFKQPFFSTIFTLSSHHPYFIPEKWKGKLKKGAHPFCETVNYTDESLRIFFQEAQKQAWYQNTIFVFLADHTPAPVDAKYATSKEIFHIPILIFDPSKQLPAQNSDEYFQQIDLFPTILDLLDIQTPFYAFGNSYFKHKNEAMSYSEGTYFYCFENYQLLFQNNQPRMLTDIKNTEPYPNDSLPFYTQKVNQIEKRIRAKIQTYNTDLVKNKLFYQQK